MCGGSIFEATGLHSNAGLIPGVLHRVYHAAPFDTCRAAGMNQRVQTVVCTGLLPMR